MMVGLLRGETHTHKEGNCLRKARKRELAAQGPVLDFPARKAAQPLPCLGLGEGYSFCKDTAAGNFGNLPLGTPV